MNLFLDFETKSRVDLKKQGGYVYAEDESTEVMCLAYGHEPDKLGLWLPGHPLDTLRAYAVDETTIFHAWNASFERAIWRHKMVPLGLPDIPIHRWRCTAARAAYSNLPRKLEECAAVLGVTQQKDMVGSKIMLKYCKPEKKTGVFLNPTVDEFIALCEYCKQDVRAEMAIDAALPEWPENEVKIWFADQAVNDRGIFVDDILLHKMQGIVAERFAALHKEMQFATFGDINTGKQTAALLSWLKDVGCELPDLKADTVEQALCREDLHPAARRVLLIRQAVATSSVAKLAAILRTRCKDGRIRGCLLYSGAGQTHRWSGKHFQPQNLPRPVSWGRDKAKAHELQEEAIRAICADRIDDIWLSWGEPLDVVVSCLRGVIRAAPGRKFVCADYAGIEARVVAWLAADNKTLSEFYANVDPYLSAASAIYKCGIEEVTKDQRQIGKVACIAEGELVTTDHGLIPIERVEKTHKIWDGTCFVSHGGVVCQGTKEVHYYDGLWATEDHIVFTEAGEMPFGAAAAKHAALLKPGTGRPRLRLGGANGAGTLVRRKVANRLCSREVPKLRAGILDLVQRVTEGEIEGVPKVFTTAACSTVAGETCGGYGAEVQKSEGCRVAKLRGKGHRIPLPLGFSRGRVGCAAFGVAPKHGVGSRGQQRALRTGEFAVRDQEHQREEHAARRGAFGVGGVGSRGKKPLRLRDNAQNVSGRRFPGNVGRESEESGQPKAQSVAYNSHAPRIVRVYDIVNCGPRHRFVVSGCLVHNCLALGYMGWVGAFQRMAAAYGVRIPDEQAAEICGAWREAHPEIVDLWRTVLSSAIGAVQTGGPIGAGSHLAFAMEGDWLRMRLPSGSSLAYYKPEVVEIEKHGKRRKVIRFLGVNQDTKKWGHVYTYGGKLVENATQAVARDLLADAKRRLVEAGAPVVLSVHDELVLEVARDCRSQHEALCKSMTRLPAWAYGLPVAAEGWTGPRYRK